MKEIELEKETEYKINNLENHKGEITKSLKRDQIDVEEKNAQEEIKKIVNYGNRRKSHIDGDQVKKLTGGCDHPKNSRCNTVKCGGSSPGDDLN